MVINIAVGVAEMLARHTNQFEERMTERTVTLENHIKKLEQKINELQKTGL